MTSWYWHVANCKVSYRCTVVSPKVTQHGSVSRLAIVVWRMTDSIGLLKTCGETDWISQPLMVTTKIIWANYFRCAAAADPSSRVGCSNASTHICLAYLWHNHAIKRSFLFDSDIHPMRKKGAVQGNRLLIGGLWSNNATGDLSFFFLNRSRFHWNCHLFWCHVMPKVFKGAVCVCCKRQIRQRHVIKSSERPDLTQSSGKLFHKDAHCDDSEVIVLSAQTRTGRLLEHICCPPNESVSVSSVCRRQNFQKELCRLFIYLFILSRFLF